MHSDKAGNDKKENYGATTVRNPDTEAMNLVFTDGQRSTTAVRSISKQDRTIINRKSKSELVLTWRITSVIEKEKAPHWETKEGKMTASKITTMAGLPLERRERPPTPKKNTRTRHKACMSEVQTGDEAVQSASCCSTHQAPALPTCRDRLRLLGKRRGTRPTRGTGTLRGLLEAETGLED